MAHAFSESSDTTHANHPSLSVRETGSVTFGGSLNNRFENGSFTTDFDYVEFCLNETD